MKNILIMLIIAIVLTTIPYLLFDNWRLKNVIALNFYTAEAQKYQDSMLFYHGKDDSMFRIYFKKCKNSIDSGFYYSKKCQQSYKIK